MIDYSAVKSKFVRVAKEWLGNSVTTVIQSHPNAPQPQRPYVVVDILSEQDESGWEIHRYVNDDDLPVYENNKLILLSYCVHGDDAMSLANKLHNMFMLDRIRGEIRTDLGAGIVSVSKVRDLPKMISDKLFDGKAEFEVTLNITDSVIDELGSIIESADFSLEVYEHPDDPDPLIIEFQIDP